MGDAIPFERDFPATAGRLHRVSPLVRRLVADNPGPMTFTGTCTYVVGRGDVAVIDPGPDLPGHLDRLLTQLGDERVSRIVVTHTHRDHSPLARALQARTGAPIVGCGPHRAFRPAIPGEPDGYASADRDHRPDRILADGEVVAGDGWTLEAVATPGHTANHLAFALREEAALFSGDHVMAWSTTVIAPPEGAMAPFLASLERLRERGERVYWPGHGGPVTDPPRLLRALLLHRRQREAAILARLTAGDETIESLTAAVYPGIAPALARAAAFSVFAHLEDMVARGLARTDGPTAMAGRYAPGVG